MEECSKSLWNLLKKQQVRSEYAADLPKANCVSQETFSARRTSPAFLFVKKEKTLWLANHVDTVDEGLDIQMSVHTLGQAHGTGMTGNLLLDGGIHTGVSHHGNTGVSGVVGLVLHPVFFHQGVPVGVAVIEVVQMFPIGGAEQILARGALQPFFVEGQHLVCNGHLTNTVFGFALHHIKILLFQMDVLLLQIQELRNAAGIVIEHMSQLSRQNGYSKSILHIRMTFFLEIREHILAQARKRIKST